VTLVNLLESLSNSQQIEGTYHSPLIDMLRYTLTSCNYLELSKGHLLLDTEAWDFIMINKIKIYVFPYLSFQVIIPCNLYNRGVR
jgi:hypothetical protein